MFRFAKGNVVALTEDYPSLGLSAGDTGVVWVLYSTTPPAYDVTFCGADGRKFDMALDEEELTEPAKSREGWESPAPRRTPAAGRTRGSLCAMKPDRRHH